jgi:tetratricopeptide (TPR) repeat protein
MRTTLEDALRVSRSNAQARMVGRDAENRIEPECWPVLKPSFTVEPHAAVFVAGCCLARNIERHLARYGFRVPTLEIEIPHTGDRDPTLNRILIKANPHLLLQEFRWAHGILQRDDVVGDDDMMPLLLPVGADKAIDLQLMDFGALPIAHALERRRVVYRAVREAFFTDLVILTLNSVEAWRDTLTDRYIARVPFPQMDPTGTRFVFERLDFADCLRAVNETVDVLLTVKAKHIVLATSPVVQRLTFTDDDIIVANSYGKCLLTAVAGQVAAERAEVDYLPLYETAVLTKQPYVWLDDLRHVAPAFTGRVIDRFVRAYRNGAADGEPDTRTEHALQVMTLLNHRMMDEALDELRRISDPESVPDAAFQYACARLALHTGDRDAARRHLRAIMKLPLPAGAALALQTVAELGDPDVKDEMVAYFVSVGKTEPRKLLGLIHSLRRVAAAEALALGRLAAREYPQEPRYLFMLGEIAAAQGDGDLVLSSLTRALEMHPGNAQACLTLGNALSAQGRIAEAVARFEEAVALDASNARYWARLADEQERLGDARRASESRRRAADLEPAAPAAAPETPLSLAGPEVVPR